MSEGILSHCPFCDRYPFIRRNDEQRTTSKEYIYTLYWVECRGCGAQGGSSKDKVAAVELWERRYQPRQRKDLPTFTLAAALQWRSRVNVAVDIFLHQNEDTRIRFLNIQDQFNKEFEEMVAGESEETSSDT